MNENKLTREGLLDEVEITVYRASGPGGQKKNKTASAVRIKHIPTGIIVIATESRSQVKNRELAWERLIAKLAALQKKPKPRIPTRTPRAAKEARLREKKERSAVKANRRAPLSDDDV